MSNVRLVLWMAAALLLAGSCHHPAGVQACGVETDDGYVTLHATSGSPTPRTIAVPETQMTDSINTGRWEFRCDR
jgi:hypothetical protein